jgi:hypothetical protein
VSQHRSILRLSSAIRAPIRHRLWILGCAAALGLAACSHSPSATTTTSTAAPRTTSTTTATVADCSTGVLQVSEAAGASSAGSSYDTFTVLNDGPSTCLLDGYPSVRFYGPSPAGGAGAGPLLAIGDQQGGPTPTPVDVTAGHSAEFLMVFSDVPVDGAGCTTVASVRIQPSTSAESISLPVSFSPCGPKVEVYPFAPPGSESP